jgi:type III pantothenate kinase
MNLIIDIGNTRIKIAVFEGNKLVDIRKFNDLSPEKIDEQITEYNTEFRQFTPVESSIVSAVRTYNDEIKNILIKRTNFIELDTGLNLPVKLIYKTPLTLGKDRIAIASAGAVLLPGQNFLAIDTGTCITYNFVNKNKEYLGGGISPGIMMRFKALNTFTDKLPLVRRHDETELIGDSTENSIISGVMNGVASEVDGIIERYKNKYPDLKIFLTGGDTEYFAKNLKNNIFANPNLVLEGLNYILDLNVET